MLASLAWRMMVASLPWLIGLDGDGPSAGRESRVPKQRTAMTNDGRGGAEFFMRMRNGWLVWERSRFRSFRGDKSPGDADDQPDGVGSVGDVSDEAGIAEKKPEDHHGDGLRVKIETGRGIEFPAHPDVAQQGVDDPGHAAEIGPAGIILSQI